MNVSTLPNGRTVYLPPEIVDKTVSYLHASIQTLLACRPTCKSLNISATAPPLPLIRANNTSSPSEILTIRDPDAKRLEVATANAEHFFHRCEPHSLPTIWTRLQIPETVTIDDPRTKVGKRVFLNWSAALGYHEMRTVYFPAAISDEQEKMVMRCRAFTSVDSGARLDWGGKLERYSNLVEPDSVE